jgi:hypothetical protein
MLHARTGRPHLVAAALAALVLTGAAGCQQARAQYDAAEDVRAFIVAVQEDDRAAFERHLDRDALRAQLLEQLRGQAGPLGNLLSEGLVDQLLRPESFRLLIERSGVKRVPTAAEIATQLRVVEDGRVCLPRSQGGPCAVTFAQEGGVWKLVAIDPGDVRIGG